MSRVELKHTYNNFASGSALKFKDTTTAFGFKPVYPGQGVSSSQRIGLKCTSTSMLVDLLFQIQTNEYPLGVLTSTSNVIQSVDGTWASGAGSIISSNNRINTYKPDMSWFANFRLFVVKCKPDFIFGNGVDPDTPNYVEWFKKNYVYYSTSSEFSNQQLVMRESTDDTGQFSILYDHQFKLSDKKTIYHFNNSFKYKQSFNFTNEDTDADAPTNVSYHFFVLPPLSQFDYSYSLATHAGAITVACNGVFKLSYVDF